METLRIHIKSKKILENNDTYITNIINTIYCRFWSETQHSPWMDILIEILAMIYYRQSSNSMSIYTLYCITIN